MNILLLSYIINTYCVRLRYYKIHTYIHIYIHTHTHIIERKMVEIPIKKKKIFNNTLNFKAQLIICI